jgi:hypothetical protein
MSNTGMDRTFCDKTIERKFHELGYKRRAVQKRMVFGGGSRKNREEWCNERKYWTVEEDWSKWIFSDESQVVIGKNNNIFI